MEIPSVCYGSAFLVAFVVAVQRRTNSEIASVGVTLVKEMIANFVESALAPMSLSANITTITTIKVKLVLRVDYDT